MRLSQLQPGGQGVVLRIEQGDPMRLRLMELGFTPGCTVMLERCGRGGDPMLLRLRGYAITLRKQEAARIIVAAEGSN